MGNDMVYVWVSLGYFFLIQCCKCHKKFAYGLLTTPSVRRRTEGGSGLLRIMRVTPKFQIRAFHLCGYSLYPNQKSIISEFIFLVSHPGTYFLPLLPPQTTMGGRDGLSQVRLAELIAICDIFGHLDIYLDCCYIYSGPKSQL